MVKTLLCIVVPALALSAAVSLPATAPRPPAPPPALTVTGLSVYFENHRPEITVSDDNRNVSATVDISTGGSGVLQGYWEVDGRVISRVSQHVTGIGAVTLTSQKSPALSAVGTGSHIVRFVVTAPLHGVPPPSALLFVVPGGVSCSIKGLNVLGPADAALMDYAPLVFSWEKNSDSTVYLVSFYENPDGKPIFSANTRSYSYTLPEQVLRKSFSPGKKYYWRVTGFDKENHTICENRRFSFSFKK